MCIGLMMSLSLLACNGCVALLIPAAVGAGVGAGWETKAILEAKEQQDKTGGAAVNAHGEAVP